MGRPPRGVGGAEEVKRAHVLMIGPPDKSETTVRGVRTRDDFQQRCHLSSSGCTFFS